MAKQYKGFVINNPTLMKEWNWEKNDSLGFSPHTLSEGSSKRVWWICENGHEWQTSIGNRTNEKNLNQCPYCQNKKAWPGYNDLVTLNPQLAKEWDYEKNGNAKPEEYTLHSGKIFWWKCGKCGFSWQTAIYAREKSGCPACSNKSVFEGKNDLATLYPDIAKDWDYEKNGELTPNSIVPGSNKRVWWQCNNGHSWKTMVCSRVRGNNCPICSKQKTVSGINDFATTHAEFIKTWDFENNTVNPQNITSGYKESVSWCCEKCGFQWHQKINNRIKKGADWCPKCEALNNTINGINLGFSKVVLGVNDLGTLNPELSEEWNNEKNEGLLPSNFTKSSGYVAWWKCKRCGYEWQASISNRNSKSNQTGCPNCAIIYQSSIAEKVVFYYIKKYFSDAKPNIRLKTLNNRELDIFIPSLNVGIEYDGGAWHNNIDADEYKDKLCKDNDIELIRIREVSCPKFNNTSHIIWTEKPKNTYIRLKKPILECLQYINEKYGVDLNIDDINIKNDYDEIIGVASHKTIDNSIETTSIIIDWDYKANSIDPKYVSLYSNKIVWWKCHKCGQKWQSTVNNRTHGQGCPYYAHKKTAPGINDLATTNPELLEEWDYEHNDLLPTQVFAGSNKKVYWKCKAYGHVWESSPNTRTSQKTRCPYCSNHKVLAGFNDLTTTNPDLIDEWDYEKNVFSPTEIVAGSNKKAWWICRACGHSWQTVIGHRTGKKPTGCPICNP